jgi:hypothetical protein
MYKMVGHYTIVHVAEPHNPVTGSGCHCITAYLNRTIQNATYLHTSMVVSGLIYSVLTNLILVYSAIVPVAAHHAPHIPPCESLVA